MTSSTCFHCAVSSVISWCRAKNLNTSSVDDSASHVSQSPAQARIEGESHRSGFATTRVKAGVTADMRREAAAVPLASRLQASSALPDSKMCEAPVA